MDLITELLIICFSDQTDAKLDTNIISLYMWKGAVNTLWLEHEVA